MALKARKQAEPIIYALVEGLNESRKQANPSQATNADATDLATALTLLNEIKGLINARARPHYDATETGGTGDFRAPAHQNLQVSAATATDLATLVALVNDIKKVHGIHVADTYAHDIADTTNVVTNADATDAATAVTLVNELKADLNNHHAEAGVHPNDDLVNIVTNANATDQATAITLANEVRGDINAHIAGAQTGHAVKLIGP